jgi:hypothetical protein
MNRKRGRAALLLLLALLVLSLVNLWLDLDENLLVGIAGGLLACLLIVGLDLLHSRRVRAAREGHALPPVRRPSDPEPVSGVPVAPGERPVAGDGR